MTVWFKLDHNLSRMFFYNLVQAPNHKIIKNIVVTTVDVVQQNWMVIRGKWQYVCNICNLCYLNGHYVNR